MGGDGYHPLFETKTAKGRIAYQLYAVSVFVGICFICAYRVSHLPPTTTTTTAQDGSRWAWIGLFIAELWFIFYWFITQFARWNPIYRHTFKDRLSQRYEKDLPGVDVFVCTADPTIEPPIMVINTVLSVMAYDYPPEKLSVYLSDDGGSELTFYALLEASRFAKHWLPFCKKFNVEPRSPAVYFSTDQSFVDDDAPLMAKQWSSIKELSTTNMESRREQTSAHTAGSKIYAQHAYDMEHKDKIALDRAKLYIPLHKRKDGTLVNKEAATNIGSRDKMENMQYVEELVKEFLIFRGFTSTLQAFERELGTDIGKGFHVDKILELIFSVYIPQFWAEDLIEVLSFFKKCFSSASELSILRYYVVHAIQSRRKNKVTEFFGMYGNDLLQRDMDWTSWFAILYLKNPSMDPQFCIYFLQEWFNALHLSVRNFLSEMFNGNRTI